MTSDDDHNADGRPAARAAPATADAWTPRGAFVSARPIASLVPRVTQKAFEKHGFAAASLIMDWEQIVGRAIAEATRPLKLKWPRGADVADPSADGERGRPGATLFLEVDPALALDVQYRLAELVERINAYFGYRAVSDIRLAQNTVSPATRAPAGRRSCPPAHQPVAPQNADADPLTAALARLGANIAGAAAKRD